MRTLSVVVPVYNDVETLREFHRRVTEHLGTISPRIDHELVFVNDGSTDGSLVVLRELLAKDPRIVIVDLSRSFGRVPAILAGWDQCRGDAVVNIRADLLDPVEQLGRMAAEWEKGADIAACERPQQAECLLSGLGSCLVRGLFRWSMPGLPAAGFDSALLSRRALEAVKRLKERNRFFQGDILWVGFDFKLIPSPGTPRTGGEEACASGPSGYPLQAFLNVSYLPIRFMSLAGFLTAMAGLGLSLVVLHAYTQGKPPFGWTPIMLVILVLGGLIMTMLGIIGEYIWRIYDETKRKPLYIVKDLQR